MEEFLEAVHTMPSTGTPQDIRNYVFAGQYLPVRGDGNCGLRAFLTALAARTGVMLPYDPPGLLDWITRLKELMVDEMKKMLATKILDERELLSIPENRDYLPRAPDLEDYFALFRTNGYFITNYDFRVLANLFGLQINVIRQNTNGNDDTQCFVRYGIQADVMITEHICILQQPGHFVPIINFTDANVAAGHLLNAREMEFTG
jgi:hypothetical protein